MKKWNIILLFVTLVGGVSAMNKKMVKKKNKIETIGFQVRGDNAKQVTDRLLKRYNTMLSPEQKCGVVQVSYSQDRETVAVSLQPNADDIKKIVRIVQARNETWLVRTFIFNKVEFVSREMLTHLAAFPNLIEIMIICDKIASDALLSIPKDIVRISVNLPQDDELKLSTPGGSWLDDWLDYNPDKRAVVWGRKLYWEYLAKQYIKKHGKK